MTLAVIKLLNGGIVEIGPNKFFRPGNDPSIPYLSLETEATGASLNLTQTAAIALSGAASVSGDVQIGTSFDLAQTNVVGLSAAASVSGDIQIVSGSLDLSQTAAIALSGSASVSGDIQIGTSFDLAQSAAIGLSASAAVSGDIEILSGALDLVQSGAIALSGSVSLSGDVQFGVGFDLAQTNVGALSGSLAVSGDVQSSLVPVVVPQGGAGRARRRVRRVVVEIDGEDFIVNSEEEAIALLDKAKAEAEEVAKVQIQRAAKAAERKPRKVITDARKTLVLPEIKAPGLEEYVSQVLSEIRDSYSSAMRTIEVAALLRKRDRDEEDDEEVLMLML